MTRRWTTPPSTLKVSPPQLCTQKREASQKKKHCFLFFVEESWGEKKSDLLPQTSLNAAVDTPVRDARRNQVVLQNVKHDLQSITDIDVVIVIIIDTIIITVVRDNCFFAYTASEMKRGQTRRTAHHPTAL